MKVALSIGLISASYLHNFVFGPRLQAEIKEGRPQTTRPTLVVVGWTSLALTHHRADPRRGPREPRELARVQRFVIGVRRSRPNAFGRSFTPGGAWRRLYSARSIIAIARSTTSGSNPSSASSSRERSSST